MGYQTYTNNDAPEAASCKEPLTTLVEEFVSARERVRRILKGVRDVIKKGLEKGVSRQKLLNAINASDEIKEKRKISESQFARYCREEFPELMVSRSSGSRNGTIPRRNESLGGTIEEKIKRRAQI
jgi:hypothetical protein